jgi:hypothetical protein
MNTATIIDSIVGLLSGDTTISGNSNVITDKFVDNPYIRSGTKVVIEVLSSQVTTSESQPFRYNRYELPVYIRIHQRKARMQDSEDQLEIITDAILSLLENSRKKISGVNGIKRISVNKSLDGEDTESRETNVEIILDILEER